MIQAHWGLDVIISEGIGSLGYGARGTGKFDFFNEKMLIFAFYVVFSGLW